MWVEKYSPKTEVITGHKTKVTVTKAGTCRTQEKNTRSKRMARTKLYKFSK